MELFLTSCQLHVSWVGGSLGPSCSAAKGAQDPGQRRRPCPASGPGCSSADRSPGTSPVWAPSHLRFQARYPEDPELSAALPTPICSPALHLSYLRGDGDPQIQLESPCAVCLDLACLGLRSRNLPTSPHLPWSHPTPTPTPKDSLLAMPPSARTPEVELSFEALPLSLGGWGRASCFPRAASCFGHQETALAPLLEPLLWLGCSVAALLGRRLGAVNSSGPRQPLPLPAHPSASPRPTGAACHQASRDSEKTEHCYPHLHQQLLSRPSLLDRALSSGDPR